MRSVPVATTLKATSPYSHIVLLTGDEVIAGIALTVTIAEPKRFAEGLNTSHPFASLTLNSVYVVVTRGETVISAPLTYPVMVPRLLISISNGPVPTIMLTFRIEDCDGQMVSPPERIATGLGLTST